MKFRLIVSLVCLVPLMYISMGHMWGWPFLNVFHGAENGITFALTQMLLMLPIMYVNRKYYITGFKTLFHGAPNKMCIRDRIYTKMGKNILKRYLKVM